MPWRDEPTFYHVLVSELMLQQTQVPRVLVKFDEFIRCFPTLASLASASLAEVLRVWQGLGYNRRAKYLHEAAKKIYQNSELNTMLLSDEAQSADSATLRSVLESLPGVGRNTAAAIMNYVYEIPTGFVETNIRTVYFNHFFGRQGELVDDRQLMEVVEETMDHERPREWFWALMDYGAHLKSLGQGRLDRSRHYKRQAPLRGSVREVRGRIIKQLTAGGLTRRELMTRVEADERFVRALAGLVSDGLVEEVSGRVSLTK